MQRFLERRTGTSVVKFLIAYYATWVLAALGFAAACSPTHFTYDFSMFRAVVSMAMSAQAIWLLWRRAKGARTFCIVTTCVSTGMSLFDLAFQGAYGDMAAIIGTVATALLIVLECLSAAAVLYILVTRTGLDREFYVQLDDTPEGPGNTWDVPLPKRLRSWSYWRDLAMYFIVFSFVGHWAEILFCNLIRAGVFMGGYDPTNAMLWDQWLFPFSAEGTALAMVVICLHPLKNWLVKRFDGRVAPALILSFLANLVVCTSIDFGTGMMANQHFELWDYRDMPFNFMGQVCLQNSLVYSIAATIVVWLAYPAMDRALRKMPKAYANALFVALAAIYAFEALLHFVDPAVAMV